MRPINEKNYHIKNLRYRQNTTKYASYLCYIIIVIDMKKKDLYKEIKKNIQKRERELKLSPQKIDQLNNYLFEFINNTEHLVYKDFCYEILNTIAKELSIPLKSLLPEEYKIIEVNQIKNEYCGLISEMPIAFCIKENHLENTI